MRFALRWIANGVAFYLGLYLVDSLIAPWFYIEKGWIAIVLAILLGCVNSLVRPFPRFKTRRNRALTWELLTAIGNFLFLQIVIWLGAPLSASSPGGLVFAAIFLTLLAALLNWTVGFKPKEKPDVVTRKHGIAGAARGRRRETGGPQPRG